MDGMTGVVLGALGATSAGMVYYLRVHLPTLIAERTRDGLRAFCKAIELRFPSHEGLTARVLPLSVEVAKRLALSPKRIQRLELAAQLRDIGLCAVPFKLVNSKQLIRWTDEDQAQYFKHAETGAAMLEHVPSLASLAPIVRWHHTSFAEIEQLKEAGVRVPIEAQILNVVSSYVWYDRWQGEMLARTWLEQGSGTEFDPAVVAAFNDVLTSSRGAQPAQELIAATH